MKILIFFVAHWYLSLFAQSFFHHRYSAHQMFTMNKFTEKIFFIFSFIVQGSSYMSPKVYGAMHRMHHAHADTEKDPHSPKYSNNLIKLMVKTYHQFKGVQDNTIELKDTFYKNLPDWKWFDKIAGSLFVKLLWSAAYVLFYVKFATAWWMFLLIPVHILMGPVHGTIVNWFAHKIGYTNHDIDNDSKNLMPFDPFMLGEGYHNNHHAHGGRANFAEKWYEIDPIYPIIRLFDWIGIIKLNQLALKR